MPPAEGQGRRQKLSKAFSEPRIVLAIDYGTTFTGLAWMQINGEVAPALSDLNLFKNWPEKNEVKVPSEVSYSLTSGNKEFRQWGYSIDTESKVLRWTKMELVKDPSPLGELEKLNELMDGLIEINNLHVESSETVEVPLHLSKTTKDIIEYYLGRIAEEWTTYISLQATHMLNEVPVDIVITHPAMWPEDARSTLIRAVCGAFNQRVLPTRRHIYTTSEPEACTLYVVHDVIKQDAGTNNPRPLKVGDCFVLCDAGGGTIDLVSYYLNSLAPVDLIRIGKVTGASIGATAIDRAFLRWIESNITGIDIHPGEYGKVGHYVSNKKVNVILDRFEFFKRSFTGTESFDLNLPKGAINTLAEDENNARLLHISADLMKEFFNESILGVRKLINQQLSQVEGAELNGIKCRVSNFFLAGGFAESVYLFEEVKRLARRYGNIQVRRAEDCWSSVVKGAALKGMAIGGPLPPKITACPRRYGLGLRGGGNWTIHPEDENALPPALLPHNELIWLVDRGDVIFSDTELRKTIKLSFKCQQLPQITAIQFVASGSDDIPHHLETLMRGDGNYYEDVKIRLDPDRVLPTEYEQYPSDRRYLGRQGFRPRDARRNDHRSLQPITAAYELSVQVELIVKHGITVNVITCKGRGQVIGTLAVSSL